MRTIKFRGKRVDYNELVEGDLIHGVGWKEGNFYILPLIKNLAQIKNCDPLDGCRVIPETVGQFTGLTDKNGKEIFEGDKVKYYQPYAKRWEEGIVKFDDCWATFAIYTNLGDEYAHESDWVKIEQIEVIGNIHENHTQP